MGAVLTLDWVQLLGLNPPSDNPDGDDHTLWSTISNLTDRRNATRGYDNRAPQVTDLARATSRRASRAMPLSTGGSALTL